MNRPGSARFLNAVYKAIREYNLPQVGILMNQVTDSDLKHKLALRVLKTAAARLDYDAFDNLYGAYGVSGQEVTDTLIRTHQFEIANFTLKTGTIQLFKPRLMRLKIWTLMPLITSYRWETITPRLNKAPTRP